MPNTRSAKKRMRQSIWRRSRNDLRKSAIRYWRREIRRLVASGRPEEAEKLLPSYQAAVDKAAQRRVIHPNRADRLKSRMVRRLSNVQR
ncbi:MAG: 30S ribosomal protein S20 [Candidatus Bipolaricaulota bacterium]